MNVAAAHLRSRPLRRRGSSLLETMIAVSVSATILLVAIGWIHQSFKLARTVKQKQQHHQQLMRLSDQFRQDVRLCQQVSRDADGRLVLSGEERGDVVYEIDGDVVSRAHLSADAAKTHREKYPLVPGSVIHWDDTELPQWITLMVYRSRGVAERSARSVVDSPVDLRVRLVVGRWRMASSEEAGR